MIEDISKEFSMPDLMTTVTITFDDGSTISMEMYQFSDEVTFDRTGHITFEKMKRLFIFLFFLGNSVENTVKSIETTRDVHEELGQIAIDAFFEEDLVKVE